MRYLMRLFAVIVLGMAVMPAYAKPTGETQELLVKKYRVLMGRLHPATGDVAIGPAEAELHPGRDYYFLPAAEAKEVLTDAWGNPPDAVNNVLGMVFPSVRPLSTIPGVRSLPMIPPATSPMRMLGHKIMTR